MPTIPEQIGLIRREMFDSQLTEKDCCKHIHGGVVVQNVGVGELDCIF